MFRGAAAPPDAPAADNPPALEAKQDAPRGAAAAALFKRDTLARLEAYRRSGDGVLSLDPLAKLCKPVDGKSVDAAVLAQMLRREKLPVAMWRSVAAALDEMDGRDTEKEDV